MDMLGIVIVIGWLGYVAGRISPDPLDGWESTLRQRMFEWRLWWIDEHMKKVSERRAALVTRNDETGAF